MPGTVPSRAVDLAAAALLAALALATLRSTFADNGWWVVGGLGIAAGVGIAAATRSWQWPGWAGGLILAGVYFGFATPLVSSGSGAELLIPDRSAVGNVLRGTFSSWGELAATLPLVDSDGIVLLVPLILGLLGAGVPALLAVHTQRPGLPMIVSGLAWTLALISGRADDGVHLLEGACFAVIGLGWIALRGARRTGEDQTREPLLDAVRLVMVALAVLLAVGSMQVLVAEQQRVLWRDSFAQGLDTSNIAMPLAGFRRYTRQPAGYVDNVYDERLLTVRGGRGLRLRFAVLDHYDGREWRAEADPSPGDSQNRYLRVGATLDNPSSGPAVEVSVKVHDAWRGNWVPTAGALQSIEFDWPGERNRRPELRYNQATSAALLTSRLNGGDDYEFTARLPDDTLSADLQPSPEPIDEQVWKQAAFLDELAQGWLASAPSPMAALLDAAAALKQRGRYSDGAFGWETRFAPGHDQRRLDAGFVRARQMVGNDEQYAALVALLANRMRIPARVVVGAVVPRGRVVSGSDVSAWVEVQVADGSWRTLETSLFMGRRPPEEDVSAKPRRQRTLTPPAPRVPTEAERAAERQLAEAIEQQQREQERADTLRPRRWWLLAVLLGLLVVAVPAAKGVRRNRRRTRGTPEQRIAGGWRELLDQAGDLGRPIARGPRPQQAGALLGAARLARIADAHTFGGRRPSDAEVVAFWDEVRAVAAQQRAAVPWHRRLLARFRPRSFLG